MTAQEILEGWDKAATPDERGLLARRTWWRPAGSYTVEVAEVERGDSL